MTRAAITFLGHEERLHLHGQTLRVLEEVGVAYRTPQALDILEEAGAIVERDALLARLPGELVERCLATVPRGVTLAGRDPRHDVVLDEESPLACCSDGEGAQIRDDLTGEVRDATLADVRDAIRLCDALPAIDFLWTSLTSPELDPLAAGLQVDALALRESGKHLQDVSPKTPAEVPFLLEMLEAVAGGSLWDRPIYSLLDCAVAPLQHDPDSTEACLELCRHGVTICLVSMPQMGTTAPLTPAGIAAVCMAEILSGVVLYQLARPGCALVSEPMPGGSDMRSGRYLGGAPEVALANLLCVEMSRFYGLPTIGSGSTTDAKAPDYQAAAEGMLLWASVALAGADGLVATSFVDSSAVFSPAKTVLDADALGMLRRFLRETPVDASTTLFDDIAAAGSGGHYLGRASTRRLARAGEVWEPRVFRRDGGAGRGDGDLVRAAAERAAALVTAHRAEPLPEDVERVIDEAIRRYAASRRA